MGMIAAFPHFCVHAFQGYNPVVDHHVQPAYRTERMTRRVPPSLTALGRKSLPDTLDIRNSTFHLRQVFKNDFFAVTAMYESPAERVILKVQRQAPFLLLPMRWAGRLLANREWAALSRLQGLPGIPRLIEQRDGTAIVREFIEGHAMRSGERVPDGFHADLRSLIRAVHDRGMAYVDLEKCENVLVGVDGRPYLVDFQIAWSWSMRRGGDLLPLRALRGWLQRGDLYHLRKLQRRTRPDQLTPEELAMTYRKPWFIRWHRTLTYPFTALRRLVLDRIDPRRGKGERGRVNPDNLIAGAE